MIENKNDSVTMKELFVGFVYDEKKEKELLSVSKSGVQAPINQYQTGFISGLERTLPILSVQPLPVFSKFCSRLIVKRDTNSTPIGTIEYVPFLNLPFIRDVQQKKSVKKSINKTLKNTDRLTVYVYSLYLPFLRAIKSLKKKHGNRLDIVLIITDIPGKYGVMRKKYTVRGIKDRLEAKPRMTLAGYADSYVFLTEQMKSLFPEKPSCIIEGFLPQIPFDYSQSRAPKSILYTGSLNGKFGIVKLVEAFKMIKDPEYQLWICGVGDSKAYVENAQKDDSRIRYFGFLPKHEITLLQTQCDVLINPRPAKDEFTKYSFPSKTMEYLLSGSKVVMFRLDGIEEEYYKYIRVIPEYSIESMARTISEAVNDSFFYKREWKQQVEWISLNKNAQTQVKKLEKIINL